ncbi:zinc-dependent metalloprotease family protein [Cytophagaceae bacterium YF14B1]|uniref:Zinc-dependent metalloprotease family protein n=1 Tax=Xanthocytophaga flava TaxID=3048013 RepID=A0AAE3UBL1_9BACT|nr:T9SS type A sorting domain-containing protein [Xanthocytophaga flavus]MDJ1485897.1 zinc-dependent metalloprotease family protein [Xanthocytophaga flavus]
MIKFSTTLLLFLVIVLITVTNDIYAQSLVSLSAPPSNSECGTEPPDTTAFDNQPWVGNNAYLESFLDSIAYPRPAARILDNGIKIWIPVKFWLYRSSSGTGGPTLLQIQQMMDNLNRVYGQDNNTTIQFYQSCEPTYINDNNNLNPDDARARQLARNNQQNGVINIHMVNSLTGGVFGRHISSAQLSFDPYKALFLTPENYTLAATGSLIAPSTVAHEVGHWLGLVHTHQFNDKGKCRREAIDRNRKWAVGGPICFRTKARVGVSFSETNGDALRDTPADHLLDNLSACNYNLTGLTDLYGDSYATPPAGSLPPDGFNLMSAGYWRPCRSRLSRLQIAVMLHYIYRVLPSSYRNNWLNVAGKFDSYEPDNSSELGRAINLGQSQERNFHLNYEGLDAYRTCDVDWAVVQPNVSGNITIRTAAILGRTTCNTRLTLFNLSGSQLAQNDNISTSNLYSTLSYNLTSGQRYLIRIENLSTNTNGYYNLFVSCPGGVDPSTLSIGGPSRFCSSASYSIAGIPANTNVTWSVSPSTIATVQTQGSPNVNLFKTTNTTGTLTATFTNSCNTTTILTKSISTGGYSSSDYPVTGPDQASCGQMVSYQTVNLPDATNYQWVNIPTGATNVSGQGTRYLSFTVPSGTYGMNVGVRVASSCDAGGSVATKFTSVSCSSGFALYPNPTSSELTIEKMSATNNVNTASDGNTTTPQATTEDKTTQLTVKLLNYYNQTVLSGQIIGSRIKLNVSKLPIGIYYLQAQYGNETAVTQQVIITR